MVPTENLCVASPPAVAEHLEEQLEGAQAALRASEEQRQDLSAAYRHVLGQPWKASAGITRRERW